MPNQVLGLFNDQPQLQYPANRPADLAQVLAGTTSQPTAQLAQPGTGAPPPKVDGLFNQGARGAAAGVAAGGSTGPSYDGTSAAINIGVGTASGAAMGAAYGGVPGAVVGGVLGFATSSLQAWQQVGAENKRKRDIDALSREIEEKQAAKDKRDRADGLSALKYDRKQAAFEKAWGVNAAQRDSITNLINQNTTLRARYLQSGVRSQYA